LGLAAPRDVRVLIVFDYRRVEIRDGIFG